MITFLSLKKEGIFAAGFFNYKQYLLKKNKKNTFEISVASIKEAVKKITSDVPLKEKLIKFGFANAKRFSWGETAKETVKVYQDVLGK